jgi:hypothetical protein
VRDTKPNPTHYAFAALQYSGVLGQLITQNVDGLHHRSISGVWSKEVTQERMLELHGTLFVSPSQVRAVKSNLTPLQKVRCNQGHDHDREAFQVNHQLHRAEVKWMLNPFIHRTCLAPPTRPGKPSQRNASGSANVHEQTQTVTYVPASLEEPSRLSIHAGSVGGRRVRFLCATELSDLCIIGRNERCTQA